jgi:hypothetical protein
MILLYKDPDMQRQMSMLHPDLKQIVLWMIHEAWDKYKEFLVVTSVYRKDGGVHQYYRGIDFGMLVYGDTEKLREATNKKFPYDKMRPNLDTIPKTDHGNAPHLHAQCKHRSL